MLLHSFSVLIIFKCYCTGPLYRHLEKSAPYVILHGFSSVKEEGDLGLEVEDVKFLFVIRLLSILNSTLLVFRLQLLY